MSPESDISASLHRGQGRRDAPLVIDSITPDSPPRMAQFSALLDRAFPVPSGAHFLEDFPIWGAHAENPRDPLLRIGVFAGEELVGCAGVRLAELQANRGAGARVALIGAVATDERFRGKGLATEIVRFACDWAAERNAAHVLLWGSEHELYRRLGFELAGAQVRVSLDELELPEAGRGVVLRTGWHPALFSLLQARGTGLVLRDEDRDWYSRHRHVEWFWLGSDGAPEAYVAVGRGIDLPALVHEFGGDRAQLALLLAKLRAERAGLSILGSPAILARADLKSRKRPVDEFLCLLRVLDPAARLPDPFWLWGLDAV